MPIVGQFGSLAGLGPLMLPGGAMESIATVTVGSGGASSIEFTSIPGGFSHLQVRGIVRAAAAVTDDNLYFRLNSDTGSNYRSHSLYGDGSTAQANTISTTSGAIATIPGASALSNAFSGFCLDVLDYGDTTKNTVTRAFAGTDRNGSGFVHIRSALWMSTSAVSTLTLIVFGGGNFSQYSTAALYGIR